MIKKILLKVLNLPVALRIRLYPRLNRLIFTCKGIKYGRNLQVYSYLPIINRGGGGITIGDNFCFTSGDAVNPICSNSEGAIYTDSPSARITIGDNVGMSSTRIWIHKSLTIGDNVKIGGMVLITDTDAHPIDYIARRSSTAESKSAPITIGDDAWIGAHCLILKGVTIGERSIIGAGSVVTHSIPPDCLAAGNPARVIRCLKAEENVEADNRKEQGKTAV